MSDSTSLNTITVDGITYNAQKYSDAAASQKVTDNSALGKDAFLQLLVTQMQYQDPLDPQDNGEYLAQLAQFSALEQMTNVAEGCVHLGQQHRYICAGGAAQSYDWPEPPVERVQQIYG